MRVHIVDLSGGWLFAFATQAWAWHGSLTPQSASVLQASPLFTGAGSLHASSGMLVASAVGALVGAAVVAPVAVVVGSLVGVSVVVASVVALPPAGGDGSGGGPQAAAAKAGAPRRSVATKVQARLEEDMKNP